MEDSEKAPLIKRPDYSSVTEVGGADAVVVQCCGLDSSRLGRVPVIRTLFKKKEPSEKVGGAACLFSNIELTCKISCLQGTFSSSFGVLLSMLGAVVGTGNIWRFPRIVANHATEGGKQNNVLMHTRTQSY